jgi:hypothetical protein
MKASGGAIEHLAFSADGERLLMVYYDATVQIVNMVDNQIMCEFERVSDEVVSSADGTIRVWRVPAFEE